MSHGVSWSDDPNKLLGFQPLPYEGYQRKAVHNHPSGLATADDKPTGAGRTAGNVHTTYKSDQWLEQMVTEKYPNEPILDQGVCDTPRTQSRASSGSIKSMKVNSKGWTPPATPANAETLGAATAGLTIQNDQAPSSAIKREFALSVDGEPPTKQLHWTETRRQPTSPQRHGVDSRQRSPRSILQRQTQQKLKSNKAVHLARVKQSDSPQRDNARASVGAASGTMHQVARDKPAALVDAPIHAPKINELEQMTMHKNGHSGTQSPGTSGATNNKAYSYGTRIDKPVKPPPPTWQPAMQRSSKHGYSGMILQPESSPISEEQLAAEIRGIYDGVTTVEAKCVDIDAALARDTKSQLGVEQWQALIALHRTLLYEHHDFLMATQHPSASEHLRSLAAKYSMPARMWKHGIHAFLEVLRHRRPESQDYMLAFVVLSYQMMALLYETVPCFTDTWIECLGDLARYRMAIEDDRDIHGLWGLVAARWYTMASDRHPDIGRLYHHLGILERPSLRKFASYTKSLTCLIPFLNARDSMATFCKPIVEEEHLSRSNFGSAEAALVTFYALVFTESDLDAVQSSASGAGKLLWEQPSAKTKEFGVSLAITSISALFQFGSPHNALWQICSDVITNEKRSARPSEIALSGSTNKFETPTLATTFAAAHVVEFYFTCCNALTRPQRTSHDNDDVLASVHVILIWFHSLHSLGSRSNDLKARNTFSSLMDPLRFSWGGLCQFLNGLCRDTPIDEGIFEAARQGSFLKAREHDKFVPLAEDYWVRGLLWGQLYPPKDLLPARTDEIESPLSPEARVRRVQWLALHLALRMDHFNYDVYRKAFVAPVSGPPAQAKVDRVDSLASTATQSNFAPTRTTTWASMSSAPTSPTTSRSSTIVSMSEDGDGFTIVPRPKKKPTPSYASVAASQPRKARPDIHRVRVAGADEEML